MSTQNAPKESQQAHVPEALRRLYGGTCKMLPLLKALLETANTPGAKLQALTDALIRPGEQICSYHALSFTAYIPAAEHPYPTP